MCHTPLPSPPPPHATTTHHHHRHTLTTATITRHRRHPDHPDWRQQQPAGKLDGISIRLLKRILENIPAGEDWSTAEVCAKHVKVITKESKQSYTEDYRRKHTGTTDVGPPALFISHAWSNSFRDLVEGVALQAKKLGYDETTRAYVCMLCNNQHEWQGRLCDAG